MYIPKGKILSKPYYTDGGEYLLSNGTEYIGFYHKDTFGNYWTGKEHDNFSLRLQYILPNVYSDNNSSTDLETLKYNKINQTSNILGPNAQSFKTNNFFVSENEYNIGYKKRYFIKYNASTSLKFDEISAETYNNFQLDTSKYHTVMYKLVLLSWRVRGPFEDQYKDNILVKPGVYSSNKRSVEDAEKRCPGISLYLTNLTEGAIIESFLNISNLYTFGNEFKTADGRNYIGFYHIHDKTGPMVGATHTKEPHGLLFPINETIVSKVMNQQTSQVINQTTSSYIPPSSPMSTDGGYSGGGGFSGGGGGGGY